MRDPWRWTKEPRGMRGGSETAAATTPPATSATTRPGMHPDGRMGGVNGRSVGQSCQVSQQQPVPGDRGTANRDRDEGRQAMNSVSPRGVHSLASGGISLPPAYTMDIAGAGRVLFSIPPGAFGWRCRTGKWGIHPIWPKSRAQYKPTRRRISSSTGAIGGKLPSCLASYSRESHGLIFPCQPVASL